jgi:methionyl-tRNA synthetase
VSPPRVFYLTTAIDYANGPPHLGHALEKIGADAMARYRRLNGEPVHFVMGMDEHGLKVMQSADAAGVSPQAWVDDIAAQFERAWQRLAISHDDFIRTTQPRHRAAVEAMIRRIADAGDFYRGRYEGHYCVGCEAYKREDELALADGVLRCPIHPQREIVWTEEENWFFRLSQYTDRLLQLYDERPGFVQPDARRNEVRNVVESGLEDISVSRARLPWGIPWPDESGTTVYVWIDALTNYLAAIGFPNDGYREYWPACHVIGKDITRFHCIYWPAMLMSAGVELPRSVWAHGFVTVGGGKLSKSEGVRLDLDELIDRHGADPFRYYLLRDVPWNGDGEFAVERFDERYTAELADDFGNLANRAISMIERYRGGRVPARGETGLDAEIATAVERYRTAMDANLLHQAAVVAMELARAANGFVETSAPWALARDTTKAAQLDAVLAALTRALAALATLLHPFMPDKTTQLAGRIGLERVPLLAELADLELGGRTVERGEILFPKPATEARSGQAS